MITYSFDLRGSKTIYEFLYEQIKNDIISGTLSPSEKLPSKRAFAKHLGISVISVENAYNQLMTEGYIYSVPKSGFYVSDLKTQNINFRSFKNYSDSYDKIQSFYSLGGTKKSNQGFTNDCSDNTTNHLNTNYNTESVNNNRTNIIADFASNSTSSSNFPFSIWTKLMRETMSEDQEKLMRKSPSNGIPELRKAIAEYLYEFRGLSISPERIIIGAGTEYLYGLIIQLLGNEHTYAIEDPGYGKLGKIYNANHVKVKYIPIDNQGIRLEKLEDSGADIVHISPSHHFPTGIITSIGRRIQLLDWAKSSDGRYIIEDDYDSEFRMSGRPIPTLSSIDESGKVIYMNTFSKSLAQTIRISYMILPDELYKIYTEKFNFYSCTVSTFEQYTLAKFIERGYFEKHINRMRNHYRNARNELLKIIKENSSVEVNITEEHAGLHFLMKVPTTLTDSELIKKASDNGIIINCLSQFYHNPEEAPEHIIIINYSGIEEAKMKEAIEILYSNISKS
jgi:GntR family transcriptional regulator/MocR family aminotransferase